MSVPDSLSAALSERYRIERELGAGGMATVYLAEDLKHDRKVAVKVLRPELAAIIGAERFLSEIKTTANLQHPHILPLFDSGQVDGTVFYVMPFVEGESLRDRLGREKQLSIADAVRITVEVASALDYAHRHGVIHRDIKPDNILLHDGRALVADFGIALAASRSEGGSRMTETGMSLGTPHYMSPEQAMGERDLDARTDVYALGCVLYEMLTGEPPFNGPSAQAIIAKVMSSEPEPVTTLRRTVPPPVAHAIHIAIQRLPVDRFPSAAKFGEALTSPTAGATVPHFAATAMPLSRNRPALLFAGLALLAAGVATWSLLRAIRAPDGGVERFALALPGGQAVEATSGTWLELTPDGGAFVYPVTGTDGVQRLWYRRLDQLDAVPIAGTENGTSPTFSPDGKQIAYVTVNPFAVKVLPVAGGQPTVARSEGVSGGGVAWSEDGYLYYDANDAVARVRPDGSGYEIVMPVDTASGESAVAWIEALPDGGGILMRIRRGGEQLEKWRIVAFDTRTQTRHELVQGLTARYSRTGQLLWATADGVLHAQRFNVDKFRLEAAPVVAATGLAVGGFGAVSFSVADNGDLAYVAGRVTQAITALTWVNRDGSRTPADSGAGESGLIRDLALSPDGSAIALQILRTSNGDVDRIWVKPSNGGPTQLVTSGPLGSGDPQWMPDSRRLIYGQVTPGGGVVLLRQRADGSGTPDTLFSSSRRIDDISVDHTGTVLSLIDEQDGLGNRGMFQFRIGIDTLPTALLQRRDVYSSAAAFSPDGHWIAYDARESGRSEVYVRPYPDVNARNRQISVEGGRNPRWGQDGRELFFVTGSGQMMSARIAYTPEFRIEGISQLFQARGVLTGGSTRYAVAPDSRRFLVIDATGGSQDQRIVLIQGAARDLAARLQQ